MASHPLFSQNWLKPIAAITSGLFLLGGTLTLGNADELRLGDPSRSKGTADRPVVNDYRPVAPKTEMIALPDIGASSGSIMTPAAERRLGGRFMSSVRRALPIIDDPLLSDYIQRLGHRLVKKCDAPNRPFTFFLIDQAMVNAFAGPGGYIGVYTGLFLESQTESELASVLAHEIAHVTQNHLFRSFERAQRMSGPAAAMMLGAILLGAASGSADAGIAGVAGVQASMVQDQINFTRANEKEADRLGIKTLDGADFDPRAMPVFFERMGHASRLYETGAPEFLRTHPVTTSRIADAMGRAEQYPHKQPNENDQFQLVRATLRLRQIESPEQGIKHFRNSLQDGRHRSEDAQRYGYALALMRARNYPEARKKIDLLLKKAPDQIFFLIASATLDEATGNGARALKTLESALELYPANYPLTMAYAGLLLDARRAAKAEAILQDAVQLLPNNANLYKLLARAAGEAGNLVAAHQYQAEYYFLSFQMESAIQQLDIALRKKGLSFYQSSRIEARLKEFQFEKEAMKRTI
jgi:predicted Zn-dependent protease